MIELNSKPFVIRKILKKTRASGFKQFEVGDRIYFKTTLRSTTGASGGGNYATLVATINITKNLRVTNSQNDLLNRLTNFELEEE